MLLLGFIFFSSNSAGQNADVFNPIDIKILKEQLYKTSKSVERAQLANKISSAYLSVEQIDSIKKYASIAIDLAMQTKLSNSKNRMLKAKAIENYGSALAFSNTIKALDTLQVALELWIETGNKSGIAGGYYALGRTYSIASKKNEAIDYFNRSLSLQKELNNKSSEAILLYEISLEQRYLGNYGDALEYSIRALKLAEEIKDTALITSTLLANSFNYLLSENYDEALEEQKKALRLYELINDTIGIATTFNDMGVTSMNADKLDEALTYHKMALELRKRQDFRSVSISYNYIAEVYVRQGKLKEALQSIKKGLNYSLKFGDSRFILEDYLMAGNINLELEDYEQAITYFNLIKDLAEKNNNTDFQAQALMKIGQAHKENGNYSRALASHRRAEQIAGPKDFKSRAFIYEQLMEIYTEQNDFRNAYAYQAKFHQMRDSIEAAVKAEKITALTQDMKYEKKRALQQASQNKEIALKESQIRTQKIIKNVSIAGLLLILVFAVIFYIRFKEKRKLSQSLEKTLSDLKATQAQLIQSEKMASLGELTAGIAHEIQNPLNFVNNFSEVSHELLDEMKDELKKGDFEEAKAISEDVKYNLEKITYHGKRADSIVKGMLQHSRSSSGEKELTDLNKLTDEYMRLAYHGLRAKDKSFNAVLNTEFDDRLESQKIVSQDIGRVLLNLFTNAYYAVNEKEQESKAQGHTSYQPKITASTSQTTTEIIITVKDNGNGIPKDSINRIFEPFYTTKPTGQGTGLGLSMSYDIIKNHGGEINVNTKTGEFTAFEIHLPKTNT